MVVKNPLRSFLFKKKEKRIIWDGQPQSGEENNLPFFGEQIWKPVSLRTSLRRSNQIKDKVFENTLTDGENIDFDVTNWHARSFYKRVTDPIKLSSFKIALARIQCCLG